MNLSALTIAAVSSAISKAAKSPDIGKVLPGEYSVDTVVRVRGTLRKGEDYTQNIVQKACPWTLLTMALSHVNKETREHILSEGIAAIVEDREIDTTEIKGSVERAMQKLAKKTQTVCSGKVTSDLTIDEA